MGSIGRITEDVMFRKSSPGGVTTSVGRQIAIQSLVEFVKVRHRGPSLVSTIDFRCGRQVGTDLRRRQLVIPNSADGPH